MINFEENKIKALEGLQKKQNKKNAMLLIEKKQAEDTSKTPWRERKLDS